jgi:hypothetical protein
VHNFTRFHKELQACSTKLPFAFFKKEMEQKIRCDKGWEHVELKNLHALFDNEMLPLAWPVSTLLSSFVPQTGESSQRTPLQSSNSIAR